MRWHRPGPRRDELRDRNRERAEWMDRDLTVRETACWTRQVHEHLRRYYEQTEK